MNGVIASNATDELIGYSASARHRKLAAMTQMTLSNRFALVILLLTQLALTSCSGPGTEQIPATTSSAEALKHFERGRDLMERLRNPEALRHFQRAVKADPDFALAYLFLADVNPSAKGFFENLQLARNHISGVSAGERLLIEGAEAAANGDPARQLELLKELVDLYPADVRAHMSLGNQYFGLQDYEQAVAQYQIAVGMQHDYAPPYNMLGYSLRSLDRYQEAAEAFKIYIELIPDDPNPYDSYAELLSRMGKFEDAITHYRKALEAEPTFGASRLGVATNLVFLGRHTDAREELAEYFELAINSGQKRAALLAAAITYVDEGDYAQAQAVYRRRYALAEAISDAAAMADDLGSIAFIQLLAHQSDEAEKNLTKALRVVEESDLFKRVKRNARLDNILGQALIELERGRLSQALSRAEEYLSEAEPLQNILRLQNAHQAIGRIALAQGDYDRAIDQLEQANQRRAWILFHLAAAYEGKKDLVRARELYERAATTYELNSLTYAAIRQEAERRAQAPGE